MLHALVEAPTDGDLIGAVLDGDVEAYGEIVARYQQRLYWVAHLLLRDHEDARDATQDAFLRAFRRLETFDRSRRFYTWVYRILTNVAIDRLRARGRERGRPVPEDIEDRGEPPDSRLMGEELRHEVLETLEELPPRYRALLILRDVDGVSGKEISDSSGVGHATIRWRIHRARKLFRQAWERRKAGKRRMEE